MSGTRAFLRELLGGAAIEPGQAALTSVGGLAVTVAWARPDAVALAARRCTPLVEVDPADGTSPARVGPAAGVVVVRVGGAELDVSEVDLAVALGDDPMRAAATVRGFLSLLSPQASSTPPQRLGALTAAVPFDLDVPYEIDDVLDAVLDGGSPRIGFDDAGPPSEVVTMLARLDGTAVGVVASRAAVGQGALSPDGCRRIGRLVSFCGRHHRPVLFFVDTIGMVHGEPSGLVELTSVRQALTTVVTETPLKLVVILGRAHGLAATLTGAVGARADYACAWPRAQIALSEPQTAEQFAAASVMTSARRGEVLDVIHPDRTREVLVEMLHLAAGERTFNNG